MKTPGNPLSPEELEALVRRVVREELAQLFPRLSRAVLDDWSHEGPDDPAQDDLLLRDALERLERAGGHPDVLIGLEELRRELARAEAAGELPR